MKNTLLKAIIFLSLIGILLSSYALYHHYSEVVGSVCNVSDKISCDIVNRSVYSEFYGIPVALIGLLGYIAFIVVSYLLIRNNNRLYKRLLFGMALIGFLFSLYLTYIEAFKLYAYCPVCILSAIIITAILIISIILLRRKN